MKLIAIILIGAVAIWMVATAVIFLLPYALALVGVAFLIGAVQRLIEPKKKD